MAQNSKIEWTHHTANLWWGCTKVHEGCNNCYAKTFATRVGKNIWGNDTPRVAIEGVWKELFKFQKRAAQRNVVELVFVGSMMDIFERSMPLMTWQGADLAETTDERRQRFFREVVPSSPNLTFLLLTKRPSNINKYIPDEWRNNPPANVMFGTSPVNPATFAHLVRQLKEVNGRRFLSVEPQLEYITLGPLTGIDWIIQGGESGHGRRPFDLRWARTMRDECAALGIPYFFKQIR